MAIKVKIRFYSFLLTAIILMSNGLTTQIFGQQNKLAVSDIDGNLYSTVIIGDQEWMTENLKTTRYDDGTPVSNVTDITEWRNVDAPGYVWYDNDISNKDTYGALYNWHAVGERQDLCPAGWRVASDEDWKKLEMHAGMSKEQANGLVWRGTNEGGKLKEAGLEKWASPNEAATNEFGLTIVPSGRRDSSGKFYDMTTGSTIWTSSETSKSCAYYRHFASTNAGIGRNPEGDKKFGLPARCIKK